MSIRAKLNLSILTLMLSFVQIEPIHADGYPPADASCSYSDTGVQYSLSLIFSGTGASFNSLSYDWEYAVLNSGNPSVISNYGSRKYFKNSNVNVLNLTYAELMSFAGSNSQATIIVFANSVYTVGQSVIRNVTGKGCYVDLPSVKNYLDQKNNNATANNNAISPNSSTSDKEPDDIIKALNKAKNAEFEPNPDSDTVRINDLTSKVAEQSVQLASLIAGLKTQLTSLTNLVLKIQKKVKAG